MKIKDFVNQLLQRAIAARASDIFLLPAGEEVLIKMRTWTGLKTMEKVSASAGQETINYLKYAAQMDISEHRRPQVGALTYRSGGKSCYLRFSSLGDFNDRESMVIRLIYQIDQSQYLLPRQLEQLQELTAKRGLIITSGPTGSGKTTTMYELAKKIGAEKMVMTIEDPVEIYERHFLQTQVNNEAGIDYIHLLKAALRHRPDILIIGEIRDPGTAKLAVNAALSGHLVLATLHAKSTLQTIARLKGLGISLAELSSCLTAVSYQRLLPIEKRQACLLDIAAGETLATRLTQTPNQDFIAWQRHLTELTQKGIIDDAIRRRFWQG